MAENMGQTPEVGPQAGGRDLGEPIRSLIDTLRHSATLRTLGLTDNVGEVARSVLCALWRNVPLRELDVIRGVLPAGIDLMFASCERPHGKRLPAARFDRGAFADDLAEHLDRPRDQALAAADTVFDALRTLSGEHGLYDASQFIESPELKTLLKCPTTCPD